MQVRFVAIFLALSLAGCQAAVTGSAAVKVGTKPPVGSAKPVASPAIKAAPNPLVRPAGSAGVLAGRVQFDPTYVVQQKAGSLIGQDGASVLAAGQARLMTGGNSGTLITNDGGSLITNDGGSLISNDGGSLITNDGGSIVAQGGGNIVAPASLISQDGGSILGGDAAAPKARRLLGTAGPGAAIAAAGMVVYARSLVTHKPLEIGRDKDNQPVYAVYTNLKGGYELYLPPDQADNVEVVAFVPGKPDPRMHFQHVSLPVATEATVSDDSSIIVNYIRVGYRSFARRLIASNNREILLDPFVKGNPAGQDFVAGRLK
ncbi:MAG: hypothetical protein JWM80_4621 [Cyanobacteria bacterium RYN_339]|nr:hypothetical protein [Cyanobacteria bacterium RYN_339]